MFARSTNHEGRQRERKVLVGEGRAPEEEHWVGRVDEAGARCRPTGFCDSLGDQVEACTEQNTRDSDDQYARSEDAQAGELDEAGGERGESWVVRGRG